MKKQLPEPSKDELLQIYNIALNKYKNEHSYGLDANYFIVKCYIESILGYLKRNDIDIEIKWSDNNFITKDLKNDESIK